MGRRKDMFSEVRSALEAAAGLLEGGARKMRVRAPKNKLFSELDKIEERARQEQSRLDELTAEKMRAEERLDEIMKESALDEGKKGERVQELVGRVAARVRELEGRIELAKRGLRVLGELRLSYEVRARQKRIEECMLLQQQVSSVSQELSAGLLTSPAEGTVAFARERFEKAYGELEERVASASQRITEQIREDESAVRRLNPPEVDHGGE